eukprot:428585-Amphidinium_carterae.1
MVVQCHVIINCSIPKEIVTYNVNGDVPYNQHQAASYKRHVSQFFQCYSVLADTIRRLSQRIRDAVAPVVTLLQLPHDTKWKRIGN